ncbi:hypothetical protein CJD44_33665 [Streptomyces sp. alain-838]|nr:hypothetical protein CJD44_33665 [Streptomyces sp. alain-838]
MHCRPDGGRYETVQALPFGKEVALPDPVGIALDTEPLKNRVRCPAPTSRSPHPAARRTKARIVRRKCRRSGPWRPPRRTAASTAASAGPYGPCR